MDKKMIRRLLDELVEEVAANRVSELKRLLEIKELLEVNGEEKKQGLELERENFRVDSFGWEQFSNKQNITVSMNPEGDIWEYVDGVFKELIGQQLFTWSAGMRETKKVGKWMPTDEEFFQFRKEDFGKIVLSGYRNTNGAFYTSGSYTHFWSSSSVSGANAWNRHLHSSLSIVYRDPNDQAFGFSVRCLKN